MQVPVPVLTPDGQSPPASASVPEPSQLWGNLTAIAALGTYSCLEKVEKTSPQS